MKQMLLAFFSLVFLESYAASLSWANVVIINGEVGYGNLRSYDFHGQVNKDGHYFATTEGPLLGYADDMGLRLKQQDRGSTPVGVVNNVWVLAMQGEVLCSDTIDSFQHLELTDWGDDTETGGVFVANPRDFYLGFEAVGQNAGDGLDRYGWLRLSVDDSGDMSIIDSGIGLYGESVIVGYANIPEPSCALLVLIGLTALALRRRLVVD